MKKKLGNLFALSLVLMLILASGIACARSVSEEAPTATGNLTDRNTVAAAGTSVDGQSQFLPSIVDVVDLVKPSVVTIDTETTYRVFRRSYTQEGAGSGWIIDQSGIIVTNAHVVDGATSIIVTLADGRTFSVDPHTIATDQAGDLAVLRIHADNLQAAAVGDSSQLKVGEWLVAIGNPLGLGISAKEGIVSRLGVSLTVENQTVNNLIETSAAINPGNSGGPLLNMRGEVIGITSAKVSSVGVEGMGYAISIDEAAPILAKLIERV